MLQWHPFDFAEGAGPGAHLHLPVLERCGIRAIFTTRLGGYSADPWSSLNLSYVSGDESQTVLRNRDRALNAIGLEASRWTGARQVHGTRVEHVLAADAGSGADSAESTIPETDALVTDAPGVAIAVLTADCVPILLADQRRRRIAVVHAGWRGMVAGIVQRAAEKFEDASSLIGVAGPAIGPCCYEVGLDVSEPAVDRFGSRVMRDRNLDLWAAAMASFRDAGIRETYIAGLCTRCESHRFFSHRAGDSGRQGVIACLTP
ncbi:MAG: peptidoglycan editing factor PgeF [Actinomycetota bacterium]